MIWTGCVAASAALSTFVPEENQSPLHLHLPHLILTGTGAFGLFLFVEYLVRRIPFFTTPGSWLVLANGISSVGHLGISLYNTIEFPGTLMVWGLLGVLLANEVAMMIIAAYAIARVGERNWRAFFVIWLIAHGCGLLQYLLYMVSIFGVVFLFGTAQIIGTVGLAIVFFVLLITAIRDVNRDGGRRNWIHWLGVGTELAWFPMTIGWWFLHWIGSL